MPQFHHFERDFSFYSLLQLYAGENYEIVLTYQTSTSAALIFLDHLPSSITPDHTCLIVLRTFATSSNCIISNVKVA